MNTAVHRSLSYLCTGLVCPTIKGWERAVLSEWRVVREPLRTIMFKLTNGRHVIGYSLHDPSGGLMTAGVHTAIAEKDVSAIGWENEEQLEVPNYEP